MSHVNVVGGGLVGLDTHDCKRENVSKFDAPNYGLSKKDQDGIGVLMAGLFILGVEVHHRLLLLYP